MATCFFQSLEPSIRSLIAAVRYYQQWAHADAGNEDRILKYNDRSLLHMSTGIEYSNRCCNQRCLKHRRMESFTSDYPVGF